MKTLRKLIGLTIIILIGIPILTAIIWTVGVTKSVLSPEFFSEVPQTIIKKTPQFTQELLEELKESEAISDPNSRKWIEAITDHHASIEEILEKSGITVWLNTEVTKKIEDIGRMLRGEIPPRTIYLDMIPLKNALKQDEFRKYFLEELEMHAPLFQLMKLFIAHKFAILIGRRIKVVGIGKVFCCTTFKKFYLVIISAFPFVCYCTEFYNKLFTYYQVNVKYYFVHFSFLNYINKLCLNTKHKRMQTYTLYFLF